MQVAARHGTPADIESIVAMYPNAAAEQVALRDMWHIADGISDPTGGSVSEMMDSDDVLVVVGTIDEVVFGFGIARIDELLPQGDGEKLGVIPVIYVVDEARQVGVAEAMLECLMTWLSERGIKRFDAVVSPGHRLAKNFFESAGFKARRITMHRHDG